MSKIEGGSEQQNPAKLHNKIQPNSTANFSQTPQQNIAKLHNKFQPNSTIKIVTILYIEKNCVILQMISRQEIWKNTVQEL